MWLQCLVYVKTDFFLGLMRLLTKYWVCLSAEGEVKQIWSAKRLIKKKKLIIYLFSFLVLHDQAIHDRNAETVQTVCALTVFLSWSKNTLLWQISSQISVFDRFHWGDGEQIKAETVITEIRWDLADVFKRRTGLHDKRKLNGSGIWECFLFFFFFLNKVRLTKTNISDSAILWVLEAYRFCKVKTSWWFVSLRFK